MLESTKLAAVYDRGWIVGFVLVGGGDLTAAIVAASVRCFFGGLRYTGIDCLVGVESA